MHISENGINLLKQFEGCRLEAYKLKNEKYYTIGYGHSADPSITADTVWTQKQADDQLKKDLEKYEKYVDKHVKLNINQNQYDALVSYTYNRGQGGIKELASKSATIEELGNNIVVYWGKNQKYKDALIKRRKKEQELFFKGMNNNNNNTPAPIKKEEVIQYATVKEVIIGHAAKNENGTYATGRAGDQTGKEVYTMQWYYRPWTHVLRLKDKQKAIKLAEAMQKACDNNHIGYAQDTRNTLLKEAEKVGYDPGKVKVNVNTDCSALVSCCLVYAGIPKGEVVRYGNSATTAVIRNYLKNYVDVYDLPMYTQTTDKLEVGDILLYEKHHVAVVVKINNKKIAINCNKSLLRKGTKGYEVTILQNALKTKGYNIAVDGVFGDKTDACVKDFQLKNHLEVDGIVGNETRKALGI